MHDAAEIVDYWLADSRASAAAAFAQKDRWYRGGPSVDAEIASQFRTEVDAALAGDLESWYLDATGALAVVILLDQFCRTLFRGTANAFSGDPKALQIAQASIDAGLDRQMSVPGRVFFYHPYHHAESSAAQERALALIESIRIDAASEWHAYIDASLKGFGGHRDIVARFGRYPHRNAVLGRTSTLEEIAYLDAGAQRFGQ